MQVMATLGDAPTAAIAVVAILLGIFFAARGPREQRGAGAAEDGERAAVLLNVPVTPPPDVEPGFVGPEGDVVGHGPIRLGVAGPLGSVQAAPAPVAPEPVVPDEPPPPPAAEPALFASPPTIPEPPEPGGSAPAQDAMHFRQGTIKVGGKPAGKPKG
jgi:hypothetical protein